MSCSVYGCPNRSSSKHKKEEQFAAEAAAGRKFSFHRFPSDPKLREKWCTAIRRDSSTLRKDSSICSAHFKDDCFEYLTLDRTFRRRLRPNSVPFSFPTFPAYLQKIAKPRKPPIERAFIPPKRIQSVITPSGTSTLAPKVNFEQSPGNLSIVIKNSLAKTFINLIGKKLNSQPPPSIEHSYSHPAPSSECGQNRSESPDSDFAASHAESPTECNQNHTEPPEPEFDPSDYIFPVEVETTDLEMRTETLSPCASMEDLISSSTVEDSSIISSPVCEPDLDQSATVVRNPIKGFVATNLVDIGSSWQSCSSCKLFSEANKLLGNTLEGSEKAISYLQAEVTQLRKQLEFNNQKVKMLERRLSHERAHKLNSAIQRS